jgi:hypothetical protein
MVYLGARQGKLRFFSSLRGVPARFKRYYLRAVGSFGIGDFSHSLLILAATQLLTPSLGVVRAAQVAGLCYVGRNVVQVMASYPVGILAHRFGALSVLVERYVLGILTAALSAVAFGQPRRSPRAGLTCQSCGESGRKIISAPIANVRAFSQSTKINRKLFGFHFASHPLTDISRTLSPAQFG